MRDTPIELGAVQPYGYGAVECVRMRIGNTSLPVMALRAQLSLSRNVKAHLNSLQRVGSGSRINRARDDAAGLSMAASLNVSRRVFSQGIRNINDGISLVDVASSGLDSVSTLAVRIRELAEQAANGIYSDAQRAALDQEAQALREEYNRIVNSTSFNRLALLDGTLNSLRIQGGFGLLNSITINVGAPQFGSLSISQTVTGDGTFGAASALTGNGTQAIARDFDNDGHMDLLTNGNGANQTINIGAGDGTFSSQATIAGGGTGRVAVTDFNNDGNLDYVTGSAHVRLGNGNGTFQAATAYTAPAATVQDVVTGDFNNDGREDFAIVSSSNGGIPNTFRLYQYLQQGDGSFVRSSNTLGGTITGSGTRFASGDLNGDGRDDLVMRTDSQIRAYTSTGSGTLNFTWSSAELDLGATRPIALSDVDGDNDLDLLTYNNNTRDLGVYLGNNNGTFGARTASAVGNINNAAEISLTDVNADDDPDVLITNGTTLYVLLGGTAGAFNAVSSFAGGLTGLAVADYDEDGAQDVMTTSAAAINFLQGLGDETTIETNTLTRLFPEFDLTTQSNALAALTEVASVMEHLSTQKGELGVGVSRLSTAYNNLSQSVESYADAQSRIEDADIAVEAAETTRTKILVEFSAAILTQANNLSSIVLDLLR